MNPYAGAGFYQPSHHDERRRLAHIIRLRFEAQTPYCKGATREVTTVTLEYMLEQLLLLVSVHALGRFQNTGIDVIRIQRLNQRLHILGEAAAAVSATSSAEHTLNH